MLKIFSIVIYRRDVSIYVVVLVKVKIEASRNAKFATLIYFKSYKYYSWKYKFGIINPENYIYFSLFEK